jgi:Domain of unknown function (DUF4037)
VLDWLSVTGQSVLEATAGPVFTDRTRALAPVQTLLTWYPPDVERYVLAAGWQRLCQLLPMMGRTAEAGDELGSRLLSAQLTWDLIWLAFALSRRWAPYAKWRGTVFRSLPVAARLGSLLDDAAAPRWRQRDPDVARLPPSVGAIEQWADSTDVLSSPGRRTALQAAYRAWTDAG